MEIEKKLREEIESLVKDYFEKVHYEQNFVPHISKVPVTGKVLFKEDLVNLVNSSLDMWLTAGEYTKSFEKSISNINKNTNAIPHVVKVAPETENMFNDTFWEEIDITYTIMLLLAEADRFDFMNICDIKLYGK